MHMFLLSPSRQYWGDLPGQRECLRDYRLLTEHGVPPQEEVENPLAGHFYKGIFLWRIDKHKKKFC